MGFFDGLKDTWTHWSTDWSNIWKNVWDQGAVQGYHGFMQAASSVWNIAQTPMNLWSGSDQATQDRKDLSNGVGQMFSGGAHVLGGVGSIPVVRQIGQTGMWATNEAVKRPFGTVDLALADSLNKNNLGGLFSGDTWRQAYDDTRYVSAGQAHIFAALSGGQWLAQHTPGITPYNPDDPAQFAATKARLDPWGLGVLAYGAQGLDPRTDAGRQKYEDSGALKYTSGSLDAMVTLAADPLRGAGSLGRAAKLRYWSGQMGSAATQKLLTGDGNWAKFTNSGSFQRTADFIKNAKSEEQVRTTLFNNHTNGGTMAALLFDTRNDPQLYSLTWRALYGDGEAWSDLTKQAPRIADTIGSKVAVFSISQTAKNYGIGNQALDDAAKAMAETKTQAFVDAMATGHGIWGKLGEGVKAGGLLTGQAVPRLRVSSQWRVGFNQFLNYGATTAMGDWKVLPFSNYTVSSVLRTALPSARGGRALDLNNPDSLRVLRDNLQQSRLDPAQVDDFVSQYARAQTAASRFNVVNSAENAALKAHAAAHGLDPSAISNSFLADLNQFRSYNRQFVNGNKIFLSDQARKLGARYAAQGMDDEARNANDLADTIDAAIGRGDHPQAHIATPDQDGNLALVPLDQSHPAGTPALLSQYEDNHVLQDWGALDSAFWWKNMGPLGNMVWKSKEATVALTELATNAWKISAILRPGYIWRTYTDEIGGPLSVMGAHRVASMATEGAKNAFWNTVNRGALIPQVIKDAVAREKADRLALRGKGGRPSALSSVVEDEAPSAGSELKQSGASSGTAGYVFGGNGGYQSYDHALADGLLSVDAFVNRLLDHGSVGTLPEAYQSLHDSYRAGLLSKADLRQYSIDEAMSNAGRDTYQSPAWQQSLIQTALDARKNKPQGTPGLPVLVDPFSGASPRLAPQNVTAHFTLGNTTRIPADAENFDQVYQFIHKNADELLMPSRMLHAYVQPDGNLALAVARYKGDTGLDALKPGAGQRLSVEWGQTKGQPLRASGLVGRDIRTGPGDDDFVHVLGAFEGQAGDRFRKQASSKGTSDAWMDRVSNRNHARLMAMSGRQWTNLSPQDNGYATAWERAAMQIGADPAAQQFLRGKSMNDVVAWLHNTDAGRAYLGQLGPYVSDYYNHVAQIAGMVDSYIPFDAGRAEASTELRQNVLEGTATYNDLAKVRDSSEMPQVHGASLEYATGAGYFGAKVRQWTNAAFNRLSNYPLDTFARFPFAADRYNFYVDQLMSSRDRWLKGEAFTQADVDAIESIAHERALVDVRKYTYDTMGQSDLGKGMRLMIPFGSALYDSAAKWGMVFRENPGRMVPVWAVWSAPDRNGMVQDDSGAHLEMKNGNEQWYMLDPKSGARVDLPADYKPNGRNIVFRLPVGGPTIDGARASVSISKTNLQTFLDLPTFGPIVAIPANKFALAHPEFASNKFVQTFIMPFGPSANSFTSAVPGNVRNWKEAWDTFVTHADTQAAENQAMSIYATEMVNFSQGKRSNAPTFEEARSKASQMAGLRFMSRLAGATAQFTSPYQPYIDYYHMLQAKPRGPADPSPDEEFYTTMGPEFFWLTTSVTKNALGIPATLQSAQAYQKYADLMQKFPDLASLIEGSEGAGVFNKAVYEAQKATQLRFGSGKNQRELIPLEDAVADTQRRLGWIQYGQLADAIHADLADRGLTSLSAKGAKDLADAKAAWLDDHTYWTDPYGAKQISPWFKDYSTQDSSKIASRLDQMRQIVQDPRLQQRDDIKGLIDYLDARDSFKALMDDQGIKQLQSGTPPSAKAKKSTKAAYALGSQWDSYVFGLKDSNLAFAALYDRWLTNDGALKAS